MSLSLSLFSSLCSGSRVEDLLKDMIQQLFKEIMQPIPVGVETMSINRLICLVNDFLQQKRYMVVFDDVWNVNAWEAKKYVLPDNNCGSRVILTTHFAHIASTCCEQTDGPGQNRRKKCFITALHFLGGSTECRFANAIVGKTIEVANGYLHKLFNRSMIQVAKRDPNGRPSNFHIHDLQAFFSTSFAVCVAGDGFIAYCILA
ncbi:hypothetical protein CsSME_00037520 [Camellia sinensis var. sinensis]